MKKKLTLVVTSVLLVAALVIGGTLAYFTDTTENVENTFTMGKVDITLDETNVNDPTGARVTSNNYTESMIPGRTFTKDPTIHVLSGSEESYVFLDMTFNKYSSLFWLMAADASADPAINFTIFNNDGTLSSDYQNDKGVFSTTKFVQKLQTDKDLRIAIVNKWFGGITHANWEIRDVIMGQTLNGKSDKYITIRFAYLNTAKAGDEIKFMDTFGIPASVTPEMFEAAKSVGKMQNSFNTDENAFNMIFKAYAIQADGLTTLDAAYTAMFPTSTTTTE